MQKLEFTQNKKMYNRYYSWEQLNVLIKKLSNSIKKSKFKPQSILCIGKGGLIPAYFLAKRLDLPVDIENISSYIGDAKSGDGIVHVAPYENKSYSDKQKKNILILDDIHDSGDTLDFLTKVHFPEAKTACLITKGEKKAKPNFVSEKVAVNTWVVFPWEKLLKDIK